MTGLPCPNCGSELAFLEQYQRHYCYACGRYAPEGFGDRGAKRCPMCTGILSYVTQYDRYYCFRCNAYPAEGVFMETKVEAATPPTAEPPTASQTALVVMEPPAAEEPKPVAVEEPTKPAAPMDVPVEPTHEPEPPARAEEEIPAEEPVPPVEKPALVRAEILVAKKLTLLDLCKAYDLDPSGTKEQLRERVLSYLDEQEAERKPETTPEEIPTEQQTEIQTEIQTENEGEIPEATRDESTPTLAQVEPVVEPKPTPRTVITAAPRMIPELQKKAIDSFPTAATPTEPVTVEPARSHTIEVESFGPSVETTTQASESIAEQARTTPTARVEHPCPTCGRELTYISQYNRWYCYSCRAYAPKARSKFACPNCGAALRWISQYERWWCDSCRRYAPADLPRPEGAPALGTSGFAVARGAPMASTTIVHRHRGPGSGIGLVGFGMILFVLYEILVDLPLALSVPNASILGPDVAFGLRFFAFLFVAVGAIMGLYALRDRR